MTDIWVCTVCRSINRLRDERCYSCGANQAEATATEADLATAPAPTDAPTAADVPADPGATGPILTVRIVVGGVEASVGDEPFQPSSVEELHDAARDLAAVGGTARIVIVDIDDSAMDRATDVVAALRAAGVPTTIDRT